jgi:hypothetical protein
MIENPDDEPDIKAEANERPLFNHPPWMLGIVLVLAVMAILAGLAEPIWFLLGLPCILVLALYLYVRIVSHFRKKK